GGAVAEGDRDGESGRRGGDAGPEQSGDDFRASPPRRHGWDDDREHEDDPWRDGDEELPIPPKPRTNSRWKEAVRAAMQTGLWWLRQQPTRRPLLTTALVALAAGSAAFVGGPTLGACGSVVASVVGPPLTAGGARSAAELAGMD